MAKRISRREFQEGLTRRLSSAARGEVSRAMLGVLAGRDHWLFDLADAGEIVPLTTLTAVPLTKPWFAGIANIRGTLYSVVDFSAFQGGEATPLNSNSRLLLIGARHGNNSALLVSRALGLKSPASFTLQDAPVPEIETLPWIGARYLDDQGCNWRKIQIKPLLNYPDFLEIGL